MTLLSDWIILIYKIPSEPTRYRASIWREIKHIGGVYLQNGACIFPDIDDVALNVSSISALIRQYGGSEYMFFTKPQTEKQALAFTELFQDARNEEYKELIAQAESLTSSCHLIQTVEELEDVQAQLKKLKRQAGIVKARDYFNAPLGEKLAELLYNIRTQIICLSKGVNNHEVDYA